MDSKKKNVNAKFIMYITITILIMAFIFFQSSLPADTSQEESDIIVRFLSRFTDRDAELMSFIVRKLAHFTEYTLLGLFISLTVKEHYHKKRYHEEQHSEKHYHDEHFHKGQFLKRIFIIPLICGVLYAASDEIHQRFVPGRSCELRDVLIDTCGVLLGVTINMLCVRFGKKKAKTRK
ncbi:MAG: VanZ family protein [Eubacterium sp.]|nr:VanZ family protein [Eubacterium sp.]